MENYAADALFLSPRKLSTFAKQRTAPFYLYDEAGIRAAAKALHETFGAFSGFRQYFPVALNPNPAILRILQEAGFGVLCDNEAQLRLAADCGFAGERILYAPMVFLPAAEALATELDCTFVLDGPHTLPHRAPKRAILSLRPAQKLRADDGTPISFDNLKTGMPEAELLRLAKRLQCGGTQSIGLILHACRNDLREAYYPAIARELFTCAVHLKGETGITPDCCNLADGMGIAYHRNTADREPSLSAIAARIGALREELLLPAGLESVRLELAAGRGVLAKHGIFVARIMAVKPLKNTLILLDAAAQQFPDASPLTTYHHVSLCGKNQIPGRILCDVAGCQMDPRGLFASRRLLPPAQPGDLLIFHDAGAGGHAQSIPGAGFAPCDEFLLTAKGEIIQI